MLKPDKHTNLKLSVFNISAIIIRHLKEAEILKYDELLTSVINESSKNSKELFIPAISFLFLLDKIEYLPDLDSLRLKNENK
jgi:hypothetical protein